MFGRVIPWLFVVCATLRFASTAPCQPHPPPSATISPAGAVKPAAPSLPPGAIARLDGGSNPFLCLAFAPDGKQVASGGYEKTIQLWDPASGKEIRSWRASEGNIGCLAFSPDGRLLASGGPLYLTVHLWDVATGQELHALTGLPGGSSSLSFSADGKTLAGGGYHTSDVYLWEVAQGKAIGQLVGSPVASAKLDALPMMKLPPDFSFVAIAPDGKTLASGHLHGLIRIWDLAGRRELRHFRGPIDDVFVHLAYSRDGSLLAGWGSTIRLWQAGSGKQLRYFGEQPDLRIAAVAFSPDGRMLASGSSGRDTGDDHVHLWEVATGLERCQLAGHKYSVSSVAFSPSGRTLVSGGRDGTAFLWDLASLPQGTVIKGQLSPEDLDRAWGDLGASAAPAYLAIRTLVRNPDRAIPYLKDHLHPVAIASPRRIEQLIAALASSRFKERRAASAELTMQVELTEPMLRRALAAHLSPEASRRLEEILQRREQHLYSGPQLQMLRGMEVLEAIGTAEAKKLLEEIAAGTPEFTITREAKASLKRLGGARK